jgi:hypothetical protein
MFVFLSLLNFTFFLLTFVGKMAEGRDPSLFDSPWAGVIAAYGIGFVTTWPLALLAGTIQTALFSNDRPSGERSRYCRKCDYILEGLAEHRCPECGQPFDPDNVLTFRRYLEHTWHWKASAAWAWVAISGVLIGWFFLQFLKFMFP